MLPELESYNLDKKNLLYIKNRVKKLFEEILANYHFRSIESYILNTIYRLALKAGIVEEMHLEKLDNIIMNDPTFPSSPMIWFGRQINTTKLLGNLVQSNNLKVFRLAAISILRLRLLPISLETRDKDTEILIDEEILTNFDVYIGDKFWELSKDTQDPWRSRYIEGMAQCRLKWSEIYESFFDDLKNEETNECQQLLGNVIAKAGYYEDKDGTALCQILLDIIESENVFSWPIQQIALERLYRLAPELENVEFNEKDLNTPLS